MAGETGAICLFGAPDPEPSPGFAIEEFNVRAPEHSDEALALRFADRHADELRYVALWSKWMVLQPTQWRPDETLLPFDLARTICREAAAECDKPQAGKQVAPAGP
jgi:putative DNA primase/helicase